MQPVTNQKAHNHHTSQTNQASSSSDKETFQAEDVDPDIELAKKLSLETPQEKGEGEGDNADLERAIKLSLDPAFLPQGRAPVGGVTIRDPVSEATPKLHETATSTPPVIAPFTEVSSSKPSLLVTPPPINTEATTITSSLPEITQFIALQLRVARLEQEMSEVKKTDHSADVLASIRS
ncbi:hypothetical protein Tco_0135609 [Tanacetum coccineum]